MVHIIKNKFVLLKNIIIRPETTFYFTVLLFLGVFVRLRRSFTLAHSCLQKISLKVRIELKILTVTGQTGFFDTREKNKVEPLFAHTVCCCLFSIRLCTRIVRLHTTPLFFCSSTLQPCDTET